MKEALSLSNKQEELIARLRWIAEEYGTRPESMKETLAAAITKPGCQTEFGHNHYRSKIGNQHVCSVHAEISLLHRVLKNKYCEKGACLQH